EAIFLTADGHVSEGGGANIFMVRDGALVTPSVTDDILEGITRDSILQIAAELGILVQERQIDRTELYVAEEVFFCGTGAQVAPVENTHAGSVADVYDLLRQHDRAKIVAELILRVSHSLLAVPGARLEDVRAARSHPQALAQVEEFLREHRIQPEVAFDTAGAAAEIAEGGDRAIAAVASRRAAERYGLDVLADAIETSRDNFTRFFALAKEGDHEIAERIPAALRSGPTKTSLVYKTANLPGALVRSLQPFA